jgi:hypothetical protein
LGKRGENKMNNETKKKGKGSKAVATNDMPVSNQPLSEQIAKKAYELYERRGCVQGHELEDWTEAEKIIRKGLEPKAQKRPKTVRTGSSRVKASHQRPPETKDDLG